jgi:hypothetical protein
MDFSMTFGNKLAAGVIGLTIGAGGVVAGVIARGWIVGPAPAAGVAPGTPARQVAAGTEAALVSAPTGVIDAAALIAAYATDEYAADETFRGRTILVAGVVSGVDRDLLHTVTVTLGGQVPSGRSVALHLPATSEGRGSKLAKGERVLAAGRCNGLLLLTVFLEEAAFATEAELEAIARSPEARRVQAGRELLGVDVPADVF